MRDISEDDELRGIDMEKTGMNIRRLMEEKNLKPADMKHICGFTSPNAIYKWFHGESLPSIDNFVLLAQTLDKTIDDIIVLRDDMNLDEVNERF